MQPGFCVLEILSAGYEVEKKPTHSVLHLKHGGSVLLRRCGKLDLLVIRVATTREISAITSPTMNLEVSLSRVKCVLCVQVICSMSEVRLPWTPEEKTSPRGQ